jgi:hypothetical protein
MWLKWSWRWKRKVAQKPWHVSELHRLTCQQPVLCRNTTAERRLALLPPTLHQRPLRELWVCRTTCSRFDSWRWYTRIHVMRGSDYAGRNADRILSWPDVMAVWVKWDSGVYTVLHALYRHTNMKTSNCTQRTHFYSDKAAVERDRTKLYLLYGPLRI